ncbi:MAG TPA: hypothetical protein VEH84_08335 [Alphaproteobacteria bacterium]|nr:hypothetical protein [Alphaproteobacteria bacterium]
MQPLIDLVLAVALAAALGAAAALTLRGPLHRALGIVCDTDVAAAFWTGYSVIFMVLLPVLGVAGSTWLYGDALTPMEALSRTLSLAIGGLILALLAIGRALWLGGQLRAKAAAPAPALAPVGAAPWQPGANP